MHTAESMYVVFTSIFLAGRKARVGDNSGDLTCCPDAGSETWFDSMSQSMSWFLGLCCN